MDIVITGLVLGGTFALIAMGLNLQYGMARIMNLANGEVLVVGAFVAFWLYTAGQVSPLLTLFVVAPLAFALNWLIYRFMLLPLVRRAKSQGQLEVDSILVTFGLSFVGAGLMWAPSSTPASSPSRTRSRARRRRWATAPSTRTSLKRWSTA